MAPTLLSASLADDEDFAAAVAGGCRLANVSLAKLLRDLAMARVEPFALEDFDGEIAAGFQPVGREPERELRQVNPARLVDAVDAGQIGGHVGEVNVDRRIAVRRIDARPVLL